MARDRQAGAPMAGKRVLITGATSGIGLATALRLTRQGARVAVLARAAAGLEAVRAQSRDAGAECLTFATDVADRQALAEQVAAAAAALGGIDVAVVNTGVSTYGRFTDTPAADFDRVFEVTFRGAVDTVREVLPHLERSGGSVVVVGSVAGRVPLPRMSAYTAAKHGVRGFVETLQVELAAQRSAVAVSLVEPGPVDTPFWHNVASADELLPPEIPLSYGPEEVAMAIERSALSRVPRTTVGGTWALLSLAYGLSRPLAQRLLAAVMLLAERRGERGPGRAAIWNPSGAGDLRQGLKMRRSLLVRGRQLSRRRRAGSAG